MPEAVKNREQLRPWLVLYWNAYCHLSTCRPVAMGEGPIPWTAVKEYAEYHELDEEQSDRLVYFVSEMDDEYLKYRESKRNEGGKKHDVRTVQSKARTIGRFGS